MAEKIIYYPGFGKKCDYCECYFNNSHDMNVHLDAKGRHPHGNSAPVDCTWRKSTYDEGEWCPSDSDPTLKRAVQQNGKVVMDHFEYFLSENGKWLRRRRVNAI